MVEAVLDTKVEAKMKARPKAMDLCKKIEGK